MLPQGFRNSTDSPHTHYLSTCELRGGENIEDGNDNTTTVSRQERVVGRMERKRELLERKKGSGQKENEVR